MIELNAKELESIIQDHKLDLEENIEESSQIINTLRYLESFLELLQNREKSVEDLR
jgi:hypothetical protein